MGSTRPSIRGLLSNRRTAWVLSFFAAYVVTARAARMQDKENMVLLFVCYSDGLTDKSLKENL